MATAQAQFTITDLNDGRGIVYEEEWYKLSNSTSETFPTGGSGWTKCPPGTIPVPTANQKYLWFYEITTYSDGTTSNWGPVVIGTYGEKGETGDTGVGYVEEKLLFYLHTSSTDAPTEPTLPVTSTSTSPRVWTTKEPAWVSGHYYWKCHQFKKTDGTYSRTDIIYDSALSSANETAAAAAAAASAAQTTADSKAQVYYRTTDPTSGEYKTGDIWVKQSSSGTGGDATWYYDGTSWVKHVIGTTTIIDGSIITDKIASGAVRADQIDAGAITTEKLDARAVTAEKIDAEAVETEKLAAGAVTAKKLAANAIKIGAANILRGTSQMLAESTGKTGWANGRWRSSIQTGVTGTVLFNQTISDSPVEGVDKGVIMTFTSTPQGTASIGIAQNWVPIRENQDLCFSVWVKAPAGSTIYLQPWWTSNTDPYTIETFTGTGVWQYLTCTCQKTVSTSGHAGYIYFQGAASGQTCYVVAPMLEYGNFPASWAPSPQDTSIEGATVINGGNIITGTIDASKATITNINANNITSGYLKAGNIKLYGAMEVYTDSGLGTGGGYIGYMSGAWKPDSSSATQTTNGIAISSSDKSHYMIVTTTGCRMTEIDGSTIRSVYLASGQLVTTGTVDVLFNGPVYLGAQILSNLNSTRALARQNVYYTDTSLFSQAVSCYGFITSSGKNAELFFRLPRMFSPIGDYTYSVSVTSVTSAGIRTADGGYLGGTSYATLTSYISAATRYADGTIHLALVNSDGWGLTNNSVLAGVMKVEGQIGVSW